MKNLMFYGMLICALLLGSTSFNNQTLHLSSRSPASDDSNTCRVITGDVGTIIGRGSNRIEAYKNAAEKCFDLRVSLYEGMRGQAVDAERGDLLIESCANISCK